MGLCAEPDYEHLRYLMRWLYEHPKEAADKARSAADWVHREWTWERIANAMYAGLDALSSE